MDATLWKVYAVLGLVTIIGAFMLWHKPKARSIFGVTIAIVAIVCLLVDMAAQAKLIPWLT